MSKDCEWIKYGAGMVYLKKQRYIDAEREFHKTLKCNPSYADAYAQLGKVCVIEGKREVAKALFKCAISFEPENQIANFHLALLNIKSGYLEKGRDILNKLLRLNPTHAGAILNLGLVYGHMGDFDRAEDYIKDAYAKKEDLKDGFIRLGLIKAKSRDWRKALELAELDRAENRLTPKGQIDLAQLHGRRGYFDEAVAIVEQAYMKSGAVKNGLARLGWIKTECRQYDSAFKLMERDRSKNRLTPQWQVNLAIVYGALADINQAKRLIEKSYSQNTTISDGYVRLGWFLYILKGDEESLYTFLKKDRDLKRLSIFGQKIRAYAMAVKKEYLNAHEYMSQIYSNNTEVMDGFGCLGWLLIDHGNRKEGISLMMEDYRAMRMSTTWKINFAYRLAQFGDVKKAERILNQVKFDEPNKKEFIIGYQNVPTAVVSISEIEKFLSSEATHEDKEIK